jgi:hypothetical protein
MRSRSTGPTADSAPRSARFPRKTGRGAGAHGIEAVCNLRFVEVPASVRADRYAYSQAPNQAGHTGYEFVRHHAKVAMWIGAAQTALEWVYLLHLFLHGPCTRWA